MTPDNTEALLSVLKQIAENLTLANKYTITGAADWPILAAVGVILIGVLAYMWRDNRAGMMDIKTDNRASMKEMKTEIVEIVKDIKKDGKSDIDAVWKALKDCQHDCCPRKKSE